MSENNKQEAAVNIHLRSEDVQDILSAPPGWMLRWSISIILLVILLLFFFAAFIKYPDIVAGQVKISTVNPPVQLMNYSNGKLIALNKNDKEKVKKDEVIAITENLLTEKTSREIQNYIQSIELELHNTGKPLSTFNQFSSLGELQPEFNKLNSLVQLYNRTVSDLFFQNNIKNIRAQIAQYKSLVDLSASQKSLSKKELESAGIKYQDSKQLFESGVISKSDFMLEESHYLLIQKQVGDLEKVKIQNLISLTDYGKQVNDLQAQHDDKLFEAAHLLYEEISTLKNQLRQWEQQYLIKAPFNGTLSYLNSWALNKYVKQGEALFTLVPEDQEYIALALVPGSNFGKIKPGQAATLRIDNYAYNELGELTGKIKSIALAPGPDNTYRVEIALDKGLLSTHKKMFEYKPEMSGTAQIITEDLSFLDRIFYRFKKLTFR